MEKSKLIEIVFIQKHNILYYIQSLLIDLCMTFRVHQAQRNRKVLGQLGSIATV